jgi:peptidoglycan/xylan/chitin deacetylase (PgdA/CDA1 family)
VADFTGALTRSIPGLLISQETFRRQLEDADRAGYEFATMSDALDVISGRRVARRDLFVVTFDDGYRDVYRYAAPVLKELGIPAVLYLPSGLVGTQRRFNHDRLFHLAQAIAGRREKVLYDSLPAEAAALLEPIARGKSVSEALDDLIGLYPSSVLESVIDALDARLGIDSNRQLEDGDVVDWAEVRAMQAQGIEIGAHTVNHTVLTHEPLERVDEEIRVSKEQIERETGRKVEHFAYCNGWYSQEVIATLAKHGFKSAVTTEDMPNHIGGDPYTLKRKVLWENFSVGLLGNYSSALTRCQIDDVFGTLGITRPVVGRRQHVTV